MALTAAAVVADPAWLPVVRLTVLCHCQAPRPANALCAGWDASKILLEHGDNAFGSRPAPRLASVDQESPEDIAAGFAQALQVRVAEYLRAPKAQVSNMRGSVSLPVHELEYDLNYVGVLMLQGDQRQQLYTTADVLIAAAAEPIEIFGLLDQRVGEEVKQLHYRAILDTTAIYGETPPSMHALLADVVLHPELASFFTERELPEPKDSSGFSGSLAAYLQALGRVRCGDQLFDGIRKRMTRRARQLVNRERYAQPLLTDEKAITTVVTRNANLASDVRNAVQHRKMACKEDQPASNEEEPKRRDVPIKPNVYISFINLANFIGAPEAARRLQHLYNQDEAFAKIVLSGFDAQPPVGE